MLQNYGSTTPGNLSTVHTLAHVKPATQMMTAGSDYPSDGGWIWATQIGGGDLYPLPTTLSKKDLPEG